MNFKFSPLWLLLAIYYAASISTLLSWHSHGVNNVTGDEPHYLVMASGIAKYCSLEQTRPYSDEFAARAIYKIGLTDFDAIPSPSNTHAVQGPHGLFNVHNIGLPLILAMPFALSGVLGTKIFMVLLSGLGVILVWKITEALSLSKKINFLTTATITLSLPLIPGSNQIYPDILAGLIAISGLYWLSTIHRARSMAIEILWMAGIAFLPWLQIKFAATAAILIFAIGLRMMMDRRTLSRSMILVTIAIVSFGLLALYNHYAFGKPSGPYQGGALEFSRTSLMVLIGLLIDQNHGLLFQNPILFLGLPAIGLAWRWNRCVTAVWLLVFLSLLVPNGLHPVWYGGFSFSGRFAWSAAITFYLPAAIGLISLAQRSPRIFTCTIIISCCIQLYFLSRYAPGLDLYNRPPTTWLSSYSIFYFPLQSMLPALYNVEWSFNFPPNIVWCMLLCAAIAAGFLRNSIFANRKLVKMTTIVFMASLIACGVSSNYFKGVEQIEYKAIELPSQTGKNSETIRIAERGRDRAGFVSFGPYILLRRGNYSVTISYSSTAPQNRQIGFVDAFNTYKWAQIAAIPLNGTLGKSTELTFKFAATNFNPRTYEVRSFWDGTDNFALQSILIRRE